MDLVETIGEIASHPATKVAGLYVANHLVVTAVRTIYRYDERVRSGAYEEMGFSEGLLRCLKRRILHPKTFLYAGMLTLAEIGLYYWSVGKNKPDISLEDFQDSLK